MEHRTGMSLGPSGQETGCTKWELGYQGSLHPLVWHQLGDRPGFFTLLQYDDPPQRGPS